MKNILLFLDDCRDPFDQEVDWLVFSPIGRDVEVIWVKSYDEFTEWIISNNLPQGICFDHDLADEHYDYFSDELEGDYIEKTGLDCAKWLIEYCYENKLNIPPYAIQSANSVGRENIDSLLKNYIKHVEFKEKD